MALRLSASGQFGDALDRLGPLGQANVDPRSTLLRLDLLERTGHYEEAADLANRLLGDGHLTDSARALCEFVLGKIASSLGKSDEGILHLQHAIVLGSTAGELERVCWARLHLMLLIADQSGPDAAATTLTEARLDVARLSEPVVSSALHIFVAQIAAQRGECDSARRHLEIARRMMASFRNTWLEAIIEHTSFGVALLSSRSDIALQCGTQALELSRACGSLSLEKARLVNLSNLSYMLGDYPGALSYAQDASMVNVSISDLSDADVDNIAKIRLAEGRDEDCEALLESLELCAPSKRLRYVHRHSLSTKLSVLMKRGSWVESLRTVEAMTAAAEASHDHLLLATAMCRRIEVYLNTAREAEAAQLLNDNIHLFFRRPLSFFSDCERLFACWLARKGRIHEGISHYSRSERVSVNLQNVPALGELAGRWKDATLGSEGRSNSAAPGLNTTLLFQEAIQSVGSLLLFGDRPGLAAQELVQLLERAGCASGVTVQMKAPADRGHVPADASSASKATAARQFTIGDPSHPSVTIEFEPASDPQAISTLGFLRAILDCIRHVAVATRHQEAEATLWPIPGDKDELRESSPAPGSMAELTALAHRIASANLCVLLTGESGTGKEVVARTIHKHSPRSAHVFLPFNCSATPRDTLESQLFGYRRGAFTGADRDQPGVIRAAQGGTLFLDEIADLDLDLQPKLLRFLESGEILPLGDTTPILVDVRVIAATNCELEPAVAEGRFREDLFYRLNVIRLRVPPLRSRRDEIPALARQFVTRAALEARKAHIRLAEETVEQLTLYRWPGNVRQLQNEIRRMVALADPDATLQPSHLSEDIQRETAPLVAHPRAAPRPSGPRPRAKLKPTIERIERAMIKAALDAHRDDLAAAATSLGISRKGLYLKRQRFGLTPENPEQKRAAKLKSLRNQNMH